MKKQYRILTGLAIFMGMTQLSIAQSDGLLLGTNKELLKALKSSANARIASGGSQSNVNLKVSSKANFSGKVNFKKSGTNKEYLEGEIEGVEGSSFYLSVTEKATEGHIILKKSGKAYKYYSETSGKAFVKPVDIHSLICIGYENAPANAPTTAPATPAAISPAMLNLQSLPGASGCVLLDFDGYNMPAGNLWNNGNPIIAAPSGMSDVEIQEHWEVVAEDYRPFNLNVTTNEQVYNSCPKNRRRRCVVTPTNTAAPGAGGVAYIGSFNWDNDVPCWVFITSGKSGGDASSHEIGHTFDLGHDGRDLPGGKEEYFVGLTNDNNSKWAPIMGAGYYKPVVQWSKGEYDFANNKQDDVATIASSKFGIGYRGDDFGNGTNTAFPLTNNSSGVINQVNGIIGSEADWDFFTFSTGGGNVSINVSTVSRHGDLDVVLRLHNSSGAVMATYTDGTPGNLNATFISNLAAGNYYLSVDGTGQGGAGNGGYSAYGSIGSYFITGNIPPVPTGVAFGYKDCNYGGYTVGLSEGNYTLAQLNTKGILNDDLSSLKITNGYEVELFENDNFSGTSIVFNSDNSCLVGNGWNDRATSAKVRVYTPPVTSKTIQAEAYSAMLGVQVELTTDVGGGQNVGYIDNGDWMAYNSINFPTSGAYKVEYRVASLNGGNRLSLDLNAGSIQLGIVDVPNTGGWQNWTTVSHTVNVNAGTYNLGIYAAVGGFNLNWIKITKVNNARLAEAENANGTNSSTSDLEVFPNPTDQVLNISTIHDLNTSHIKILDLVGNEVLEKSQPLSQINVSLLKSGIYSVELILEDNTKIIKRFVKQ